MIYRFKLQLESKVAVVAFSELNQKCRVTITKYKLFNKNQYKYQHYSLIVGQMNRHNYKNSIVLKNIYIPLRVFLLKS